MINDLVFHGGFRGASIGNQQFTMRNITFNDSVTAIYQLWDWGWTYKSIHINNCSVGIDITALGAGSQEVGSITLFDSTISNTKVGISTAHTLSQTDTRGSMVLENVQLNNVPIAIQGPGSTTFLPGTAGSGTITGWGQGHAYTPGGPTNFQGPVPPFVRPPCLLKGGIYYERSKPQYGITDVHKFRSTRDGGAKGDGITDDTTALQTVINNAAAAGDIVFFDAGTYKITDTLHIPKGSKLVGEAYPVIMSSGKKFADVGNPRAVVAVGKTGDQGAVEWVDMIVSTQGAQAGAILIQWNITAPTSAPSGLWDVHTRVCFPYSLDLWL
jgi:glucan 1,3-beta-glucosidase